MFLDFYVFYVFYVCVGDMHCTRMLPCLVAQCNNSACEENKPCCEVRCKLSLSPWP